MGIRFNADEVIQMAVRAEENGGRFYRRAAELHAATGAVALLRQLAAMEDDHLRIFTEMRESCAGAAAAEVEFDPYLEATLYLNAMADGDAGEGAPRMAAQLTGRESIEDILRMAIQFEQKAILFFTSLADLVPAELGRDKVYRVVEEEKQHVVSLARALREHREAKRG